VALVSCGLLITGCRRRSLEVGASVDELQRDVEQFQRQPGHEAAVQASAPEPVAQDSAAASDPERLPEDPVAGARSVAQWREHLEEEERERKANYDRRHLKEHRAVVAFLRGARASYDNAKTALDLKRLQSSWPSAVLAIRKRIDKIDPWRVNSNLLKDYEALLEAFETRYPAARLAELGGDATAATDVRGDVEAHLKHIDDWLTEAERAEDE
jgi:hypothetical protein